MVSRDCKADKNERGAADEQQSRTSHAATSNGKDLDDPTGDNLSELRCSREIVRAELFALMSARIAMLKSGEIVHPTNGSSTGFSLIEDSDGDFLVDLALTMDANQAGVEESLKSLLKQLPAKLVPAVEAGRVVSSDTAPRLSSDSISESKSKFPKAELEDKASVLLEALGYQLHAVKLYMVPLADEVLQIAMMYVDFPDEDAIRMHELRRVLEKEYDIVIRFQNEFYNWQVIA